MYCDWERSRYGSYPEAKQQVFIARVKSQNNLLLWLIWTEGVNGKCAPSGSTTVSEVTNAAASHSSHHSRNQKKATLFSTPNLTFEQYVAIYITVLSKTQHFIIVWCSVMYCLVSAENYINQHFGVQLQPKLHYSSPFYLCITEIGL